MSDVRPYPTTCTIGEFRFDPVRGCWTECVHCGFLAWDHPLSDPAQDLRNHVRMWREGGHVGDFPPTMHPAPRSDA